MENRVSLLTLCRVYVGLSFLMAKDRSGVLWKMNRQW